MKVGICHSKLGADADAVYLAWDKGVRRFGDTPIHCYSTTNLTKEKPDVLFMVSYPQYDNINERLIEDDADLVKHSVNFRWSPTNAFRKQILKLAGEMGIRIIFLDTGILKCDRSRSGNKDNYFQVGYDCIKGLGLYYNDDVPDDRLNKLDIEIKEWQPVPDFPTVLIFGQVQFGIGSQHIDIHCWYRKCMQYLHNKAKIAYLEHPNVEYPYTNHKINYKLITNREDKFNGIHTTLSFSSNASIEAIINGIPSTVMSRLSPAYNIASNSLEEATNPKTFDRKPWLQKLAYTQWTINEIEAGECWNHLRPYAMELPSARYPIIQKNT
jgi:hypothetical protein